MLLGGSRDPQCPLEAATHTAELLSSVRDKQLLLFGKPYGHVDDYGHFDLLVGKRAATEVWPHITAFLAARRLARRGRGAIIAQVNARAAASCACTSRTAPCAST